MFQSPSKEEEVRRANHMREASNNLYIFEYRSSRSKSKKKNMWDMTDTKYQKSAAYLLKKQEIKQKMSQPSQDNNQMDHRSNINRLISILGKSRTFIKTSDSGCEKVIRAISRMLNSQSCLKGAIESMKRYTMTCSSNNLQLFLQSKHNMKETLKIKQNEANLQEISQNEENGLFGEVSKNCQINKNGTHFLNESKDSISFHLDSPRPVKAESKGNITTREDLNSEQSDTPVKKWKGETKLKYQMQLSKQIQPRIAKTPLACYIDSQSICGSIDVRQEVYSASNIFEIDKMPSAQPESSYEKESDDIQLMFSQVAFLLKSRPQPQSQHQVKFQFKPTPQYSFQPQPKLIQAKGSKVSGKCPSPIYNLLYALPISMTPQPTEPLATEAKRSNAKSKVFKKDSKKEGILTPTEYAEKMLFGETIKLQEKLPQAPLVRNPLMHESNRRRVSSLPKITFTYTSREKYQMEASPDNKAPGFPLTVYRTQREGTQKEASCKNTSKGDVQTSISSKQGISNRYSPRFVHPAPTPQENEYHTPGVIRNPIRHHKIAVSPRHQDQSSMKSSFNPNGLVFPPQGVRNQYYGDPNQNMKQFDMMTQAMDQRRERVLTAQPGWQNDVEFVSVERQLPLCCWQGKQTRSRSLNDRMLVGNIPQTRFI